ncbi:zinc finger protein [Vairimorpha apis BRL 01]|uniref:Palmitoyltransferase n=2 Tax=Vairimorpha apis BRL 01 TaxID=1037528 RepID=T0MBU1_9MICR|nr:zinc finger protein [Vairimorpha apis BRL 01]
MNLQTNDMYRFFSLILLLLLQSLITSFIYKKLYDSWNIYILILNFLTIFFLLSVHFRKGYVKINKKAVLSKRYCRVCKNYKPYRTHHCSSCNKCIKKMDHHCMWIGACVNYDNHGDFIRFLFFTFINTIINLILALIFITVEYMTSLIVMMLAFTFTLNCILFIIILCMGKIQINLINRNVTYIEDLNYFEFESEGVYDKGLWENWREVMGDFKWLWLGRPNGNGMNFLGDDLIENENIEIF